MNSTPFCPPYWQCKFNISNQLSPIVHACTDHFATKAPKDDPQAKLWVLPHGVENFIFSLTKRAPLDSWNCVPLRRRMTRQAVREFFLTFAESLARDIHEAHCTVTVRTERHECGLGSMCKKDFHGLAVSPLKNMHASMPCLDVCISVHTDV
jgi:hypothetical protein